VSAVASIQAAIAADAVRHREVVEAGPFTCTFSETSDPFLNYAIPAAGAEPGGAEVAALVDAFRARERKPRLEYVASLAPAVWPALEAAGFAVELRTPLMVFRGGAAVAAPDGIELVAARSDADIREAVRVQFDAYEESEPPAESRIRRVAASLDEGGILVLARDARSGEGAGAGMCTPPYESACELVGVGVRERYRRRGIAAAIVSDLARRATARGTQTVFLMAHGEPEERIYARVGFQTIGEVIHVSLQTGVTPVSEA
jgi:GNAT superfamily N-acetyltransferase